MSKAEWIVALMDGNRIGRCERCGKTLVMGLPEDVTVVVAAIRAFVKVHERCRPRPNGAALAKEEL